MPIKPVPVLFTCPKCSWSIVFAPKSDVLTELYPNKCPKCGCEDLDAKSVGLLDKLAVSFGRILKS